MAPPYADPIPMTVEPCRVDHGGTVSEEPDAVCVTDEDNWQLVKRNVTPAHRCDLRDLCTISMEKKNGKGDSKVFKPKS